MIVRIVIIVVFCLSVSHHGDASIMFVDIILLHMVPIVTSKKEIIICVLLAAGSAREALVVVLEIIVTFMRIIMLVARVIGQKIRGQITSAQVIGSKEDG